MPYHYTCDFCGVPFSSYNNDRKYCSTQCSHNAKKKPVQVKICPKCGKEFYNRRHDTIYCSYECAFPKTVYQFTCLQCHTMFTDNKHKDRIYCSMKCFHVANDKGSEIRICPICGVNFQTTLRKPRKTCSKECAKKAKSATAKNRKVFRGGIRQLIKRIEVHCALCGAVIYKLPSRVRAGANHFCCVEHHYEYMRVPLVTQTCQSCNNQYQVDRGQIKHRGSNYCSKECFSAGMSVAKRGKNNPNWKGGTSNIYRKSNYGANWNRQRRRARTRDNFTCQSCGWVYDGKKPINVHHRIRFPDFDSDWESANSLSNLVCLCRKCHGGVHAGTILCP